MKIIIAGGRDFEGDGADELWVQQQLRKMKATEVVSGTARGADQFGEMMAEQIGLPVKRFPAQWNKYGRSAGYRRNEEMADYADGAIILPGGSGTAHMKELAERVLDVVVTM